jgi:hypothetical protein
LGLFSYAGSTSATELRDNIDNIFIHASQIAMAEKVPKTKEAIQIFTKKITNLPRLDGIEILINFLKFFELWLDKLAPAVNRLYTQRVSDSPLPRDPYRPFLKEYLEIFIAATFP